jgi:hypothetical protein
MRMTKKRRNAKWEREDARWKKKMATLEWQLCEVLSHHCGERGQSEGAMETLERIIYERNRALEILALDRLRQHPVL